MSSIEILVVVAIIIFWKMERNFFSVLVKSRTRDNVVPTKKVSGRIMQWRV